MSDYAKGIDDCEKGAEPRLNMSAGYYNGYGYQYEKEQQSTNEVKQDEARRLAN